MSEPARFISSVRRGSTFLTLASISLVVAADRLFYRQTLGCTVGIFAALLLVALVLRPVRRRSRGAAGVAALAVLGLAMALVEEPTPLAICVTCIAIIVLAITRREGWSASTPVWMKRLAYFVFLGWFRIARDLGTAVKWSRRHPAAGLGGPAAAVWGIGKWVIPLVLGSVFIALFAMANPVVEDLITRTMAWMSHRLAQLPELLDAVRILFWCAVLVIVWALFRVRIGRAKPKRPLTHLRRPPPPLPLLGAGVANTAAAAPTRTILSIDRHGLVERCLIVFNLIFAGESALDVFYLWGGRHLPRGLSFKEYAHRGAYPLIATALLAAAFVLIAFRRDCNGRTWRKARLLVYAWIAQNVLLTFSAGWRLRLLVDASNLTRWRLATAIWLGLVALGLLTIVWRIVTHRDNAALLRVNIALTACVLYICCFLNLDGFIANYNARHCMEVARNGDVLGLTYLRDLGIESIPALDRLSHTLDTPQRRAMAHGFADELRATVDDDLSTWQGWTWRRWRLRSADDHAPLRRAR